LDSKNKKNLWTDTWNWV